MSLPYIVKYALLLPKHVPITPSVYSFKRRLDLAWKDIPLKYHLIYLLLVGFFQRFINMRG